MERFGPRREPLVARWHRCWSRRVGSTAGAAHRLERLGHSGGERVFGQDTCAGTNLAFLAVKADDEVVAGARGGDVQQPETLVFVHLVVERFPGVVTPRRHVGGEAQHDVCSGRKADRGPPRWVANASGHTGEHGDGEFEALGTMDRHDPDAVVVGLGQHGLGDPGIVSPLQASPLQLGAEVDPACIDPRSRLVDNESQPPPNVSRCGSRHSGLKNAALAYEAIEQFGRGGPQAGVVELLQVTKASGDRMIDRLFGNRIADAEAAPYPETPVGEIVVAAAEDKRAEGGDGGKFVGRVRNRSERKEKLANLSSRVDE